MIWNREMECLGRAEMEKLQLERLQATVRRAYDRVPLFRERCQERGITPDAIRTLQDLTRLPFMTKSDLRDTYPFGLFAEPLSKVVRIHASSGTRGKPTVVGYTSGDISIWAEVCARSFCLAGGQPGDVFHNSYGYGLFTGGLGLHYGVELAGGAVVPASVGNTARQTMLIQDLKPKGISCTPSYLLNIADQLEAQGIDTRSVSLRYAILGAEPWSEAMRQNLEERLDLDAVDIYGLSEVIGPGVACECAEAKQGLHVQEDHFLPEVIDPATGEPLPDGEYGELVFTSLTKEAFPVIRYRTADIAALYREPCICGRTTVRMSRVKGRADDMLIIRGINLFPSEVEFQLLQFAELTPHYQLVVSREGALDSVLVRVEVAEAAAANWGEFTPDHPEVLSLTKRVSNHLKNYTGLTLNLELLPPATLPRSEGKAVRVVDLRK